VSSLNFDKPISVRRNIYVHVCM